MPQLIRTPRVNNNDDTVKLSRIFVEIGSKIRAGDPVLDVETDKATFTVESEFEGYLLAINYQEGEMIAVGSELAWIGSSPDEPLEDTAKQDAGVGQHAEPSLKALLLLKQYGLSASQVPHSGTQLAASDVRRYAATHVASPVSSPSARETASRPNVSYREVAYTPQERGMLKSVSWQREQAAPGYLDISYDPAPWRTYAAAFRDATGLWYDPLLALMSWRLAKLAVEHPRVNATASPQTALLYDCVNLGFTVQADAVLYLVVVKDAGNLEEKDFVRELSGLQLSAMRHALTADETSDATVSFSSMARWPVSRHVPVLPPNTALIVAHTAPEGSAATLGATYDHRLLTGFDVVRVLQALAKPGEED